MPRLVYSEKFAKIKEDIPTEEAMRYKSFDMSSDYLDFYNIKLLKGRNFDEKYNDKYSNNILVNETTVKLLGLGEDPIGKSIFVQNKPFYWEGKLYEDEYEEKKIVGVIEDFIYHSPTMPIEPLIISYSYNSYTYAVKSYPGRYEEMVNSITNKIEIGRASCRVRVSAME